MTRSILWASLLCALWAAGCARPTEHALLSDTVWGPERIVLDHSVRVPADVVLRVAPGTEVLFAPHARLYVEGRLLVQGERDQPVRLAARDGGRRPWGGLLFANTTASNLLRHARVEDAAAAGVYLTVRESRLDLEHVVFDGAHAQIIETVRSSMRIENCEFPYVGEFEVIRGERIPDGGRFEVLGSVFQPNTGYKDIIDFSLCARPGPIPRFIGNIFHGGGDDGLDLDACDALVERNLFVHFKREGHKHDSNAISLGKGSRVTARNNVFAHNDHGILSRSGSVITSEGNIYYRNRFAAITFKAKDHEPGSALIRGDQFLENDPVFLHVPVTLTIEQSILPNAERFGLTNQEVPPGPVPDPVPDMLDALRSAS